MTDSMALCGKSTMKIFISNHLRCVIARSVLIVSFRLFDFHPFLEDLSLSLPTYDPQLSLSLTRSVYVQFSCGTFEMVLVNQIVASAIISIERKFDLRKKSSKTGRFSKNFVCPKHYRRHHQPMLSFLRVFFFHFAFNFHLLCNMTIASNKYFH